MAKRIIRKTFRDDRVHSEIKDHCVDRLINFAYFEFSDVLVKLKFTLVAPSVKWHLIRKWIEEEDKAMLQPAPVRFFHQRSNVHNAERYKPEINPEKFICMGTGKKAAGYVSVKKVNSELVLHYLQKQQAVVNGACVAYNKLKHEAQRQGVLPGLSDPLQVPASLSVLD